MTSPDTQHSEATYGGPPNYPTSQMVPPEFWRKEVAGDPDNKQVITVEKNGPFDTVQHEVEPGWDKPVYVGPSEDDPDA